MKLLDLFCGAGGASMGYHCAGFEVVGVDIAPQPRYPFEFIQADALPYLVDHWREFDAIHASPPCQAHSALSKIWIARMGAAAWSAKHPDMIPDTRRLLAATDKPWIMENVPGAPMIAPVMLCGTFFGLKVYRHRLFESNRLLLVPAHTPHRDNCPAVGLGLSQRGFISITGHGGFGFPGGWEYAKRAIGIDWMSRAELSQAIPPAYTEYLGQQLIKYCG